MQMTANKVLRTYVTLTLLSTLAASFIWGVNTLFLLDAGLNITEAFAANAFFTLGQVLFEVPTGVVADTAGRRKSYLLGAVTLLVSTLLYLYLWQIHGAFWMWAGASMLLGLGFTFFSGATEAWLVDALHFTKYSGTLETAFAKGQVAGGIAMLAGTFAGGLVAQFTDLGMPYLVRVVLLGLTFGVAFVMMRDIGFAPIKGVKVRTQVKAITRNSIKYGLGNRPVRWLMLAAPFATAVGFYGFYAMQPYLLQLYGQADSYAIAGLAATLVSATQIMGGMLAPQIARWFHLRTEVLLATILASSVVLIFIGLIANIWVALGLFAIWGVAFAVATPVRQAYLNTLIPSAQRATVLSSDNLFGSGGGAVIQPALGRSADVWGYGVSYVLSGIVSLCSIPFVLLARREKAVSDSITPKSALDK